MEKKRVLPKMLEERTEIENSIQGFGKTLGRKMGKTCKKCGKGIDKKYQYCYNCNPNYSIFTKQEQEAKVKCPRCEKKVFSGLECCGEVRRK